MSKLKKSTFNNETISEERGSTFSERESIQCTNTYKTYYK